MQRPVDSVQGSRCREVQLYLFYIDTTQCFRREPYIIHVCPLRLIKCQYNARSDWFKQRARACFMRVQRTKITDARAIRRVCFENKGKFVRQIIDFYHKTNKKASTVLCSVIKHSGSGESTQEVGRNARLSARISPYTSFMLVPLPACFIPEQSTVEAFFIKDYF